MSASRLEHVASRARALLERNPLLPSAAACDAVVARNSVRRQHRWGEALATVIADPRFADRAERLARHLSDVSNDGFLRQEAPAVLTVRTDPYRSSALAVWMDGLARGADWLRCGADGDIMRYYLQPDLTDQDLDIERQPTRTLGCGTGLVPVARLAGSPMMQARLSQCLPDFPGPEYPALDDADLDRIRDHLDAAVTLAATVDPGGYRRLVAAIHTLHVGIRLDPLSSFSSSNELPGSAIVVLSRERLESGDQAATAAQLMHEVGHVLLGLYTTSATKPLPRDLLYISPYKNDLQAFESILHMAYTIPWECAFRMACLPLQTRSDQTSREIAFIIAYAARQLPLIDLVRTGFERLGDDVLQDLPDIVAIPSWTAEIVALVDQLLDQEPLQRRKAHLAERERVVNRQAWDIGQMLLRGRNPIDPRLGAYEIFDGGNSVRLFYHGRQHRIRRSAYRPTGKDYGGYINEIGEMEKAS